MAVVKPDKSLNPNVDQIYPIVNEVFQQMTGKKEIQAVDTNSLIAMGKELDVLGRKDIWLNTLFLRIGLTIDDYRVYSNKLSNMARSNMEWGALVQKYRVEMPEAMPEDSVDVGQLDGQSVDQWIITNPKVHQRIFDKQVPYTFRTTIQEEWLDDAFLSAGAMAAFINQIFGQVKNKIEFTNEELGRLCYANFILNMIPKQEIHLVSMFNSANGTSYTPITGKFEPELLRYSVGVINNVSKKMESMSVLFNAEGYTRFTDRSKQKFYVLADFMTALETMVSYAAFNPKYVTANPDVMVPYWQASGTSANMTDWDSITSIAGTTKDGTECKVSNLIGFIYDYDALGTFRDKKKVRSTPVNARALYYNVFWHERQFWFNDMSENGVAFYFD